MEEDDMESNKQELVAEENQNFSQRTLFFKYEHMFSHVNC